MAVEFERMLNRYRRAAARVFYRRPVKLRNAVPLVSFTFDDFPRSALYTGGAILREYGFAGTYYASMGLMDSVNATGRIFSSGDLEPLLRNGHELGCHTYDHCHACFTRPDRFERSVRKNACAVAALVPGVRLRSLSYPISVPRPEIKRRCGAIFSCCRSGGQAPNFGTADLNHLRSFFLEQSRDDPGVIMRAIDENARDCGWLIFSTHDVSHNPTQFGVTADLFRQVVHHSVASGATVLPVGAALHMITADA